MFELLATDFGVQVEVVGQALDDDRQVVSVGRHLTLDSLRDAEQLREDLGVSFRRQANPLRSVLRAKDLHQVFGQTVVKEPSADRTVCLSDQSFLSFGRERDETCKSGNGNDVGPWHLQSFKTYRLKKLALPPTWSRFILLSLSVI